MSALASILSDYRESVSRQKAARRMGDRAVRLMPPDFRGQSVADETQGNRDVDSSGHVVRRARVVVRTEAEATAATAWAVGQNVRAARLKAGLTQADLAKATGIARPNIARVESGRHAASTDTLRRISNALRVELTILLATPVPSTEEDAVAEAGMDEWTDALSAEDGA